MEMLSNTNGEYNKRDKFNPWQGENGKYIVPRQYINAVQQLIVQKFG